MGKRVIIVHGWGGNPEEGWFPWLKKQSENRGFEVLTPVMPETDNPRIEKWIPALAKVMGVINEETYFVGHSMGCQAIARFLETLPVDIKIGGAIFVAGFFKRLTGLDNGPKVQLMIRHWLEASLDFEKVKSNLPRSIAIFSDNDPYVPIDNQDDFREKLGSKIIVEHSKGHFSGSDGFRELPIVLTSLLEISKK